MEIVDITMVHHGRKLFIRRVYFMKKIRKVLSLMLVIVLVIGLMTACGEKKPAADETKAEVATSGEEETKTEDGKEAEPVNLKVVTMMGGTDPNTEKFHKVIEGFNAQYPNVTIEDYSQVADQDWKVQIAADFAVDNEPDIIQFFTDTNASDVLATNKFVPLSDIQAEYPEVAKNTLQGALNATKSPVDGVNYAVPTTGYWEGLFCNKDLFDQYKLELPTDWDKLTKAIETFKANGITPIAVSLNEVPNYWIEFLMMSGSTSEEFTQIPTEAPEGWVKGLSLLKDLRDMGAFPEDTDTIDNDMAGNLFKEKKAAMQLDGSWYLGGIPDQENTVVCAFPTLLDGKAAEGSAITGFSSGFYITKKAWEDPAKKEAAVNFLLANTNDEQIIKYWGGNGACSVPVVEGVIELTPLQVSGGNYSGTIQVPLAPTDARMSQEAFTTLKDYVISISTGEISAKDAINEMLSIHNR